MSLLRPAAGGEFRKAGFFPVGYQDIAWIIAVFPGSVSEGDAQNLCLLDDLIVCGNVFQFAGGIFQRDGRYFVTFHDNHSAVFFFMDQFGSGSAQTAGDDTVERYRASASLCVSRNGNTYFLTGSCLNLCGKLIADSGVLAVGKFLFVFLFG